MKYLASLLLISSVLVAHPAAAQNLANPAETLEPVMCTMDVMQCPDGSFVGRTGPQCAFVCPNSANETEPPLISDPAPEIDPVDRTITTRPLENRSAREALRAERQVTLSAARQQRIINLAANISNRMDAAVNRLFTIIARLESRIQKSELAGIDTTAATQSLQEASRTLAEARSLLSGIDSLVYEATTSDTAYGKWQDLRLHYQTTASLIRGTHTSLRQTIAQLKSAPPREASTNEDSTDTTAEPLSPSNLSPTL